MKHHVNCSITRSRVLFTKALNHDSIKRHTESMGCELMFERDPFALTVNNLSVTLSMKKLATETERLFGTKARIDAWTRMDMHSNTYDTTSKGGPA